MFCPNCGTQTNSKFCPNCGTQIEQKKQPFQRIELKCKICGGTMIIDNDQDTLHCSSCGSTEVMAYSDNVTSEKIKSRAYERVEKGWQQAYKEVEFKKIEEYAEQNRRNAIKERIKEENDNIVRFKKSLLSKVLILCIILFSFITIICIENREYVPGFISLLQAILFSIAWLTGMHIIKEYKKHQHILLACIGFSLIFPLLFSNNILFSIRSIQQQAGERITAWPSNSFTELIPIPKFKRGALHSNSDTLFSIDIHNMDLEEANTYVEHCKEFGFVIDSEHRNSVYSAFNEQGYSLTVAFKQDKKILNIRIESPRKMSEFSWPKNNLTKHLPVPKSNSGDIGWNNSDSFSIYIGNTSKNEYIEYVQQCLESGFDFEYSQDDNHFYAKDKKGYDLSIVYVGFNTIYISINSYDVK